MLLARKLIRPSRQRLQLSCYKRQKLEAARTKSTKLRGGKEPITDPRIIEELPSGEVRTPEEKDFMKTMEQIDAWYEAEINKAKLEGKLEGKIESASTIIRAKFGTSFLTPQIVSQLEKLNDRQLDDFIVGMFNWQQQEEMEEWLSGIEKV